MGKHYHKLFTFLLVIALFITARMSIFTNDAVYAKQSATPQTMSRLLQPSLRSNNAGSFNVTGGVSGVDWTYIGSTLTIIKSGTYTITGDGQQTSENIVVDDNFKGTIEINNINILAATPFSIANATVTLVIHGENTLATTAILQDRFGAGLKVGSTGKLIIQGDGNLSAKGELGAGIGGDYNSGFGSITINSGVIQATGVLGASIGNGASATSCGDITINGGIVTSHSSNISSGAAIGGGYTSGNAGRITINGGDITAYSSGLSTGIGSGYSNTKLDDGGTITINGGNINAYSDSGAAIGSAGTPTSAGATKVDIVINGGTVTAETNRNNPTMDIGYGENGVPGSLIIKGGSVKAVTNRMITPTDGLGHTVYLAKVGTHTGGDVLDVDGSTFTRSGNHMSNDSSFYLYLAPQDHTITNHNWKTTAKWDANDNRFIVEPMLSSGVLTNVMYDNTTSIPEPDNPTNPDWEVLVPSSITFTDNTKKIAADVSIQTVNGGTMPAYPIDVMVRSNNGYKLKLDSTSLSYDLQYKQKNTWESMKKYKDQPGKLGTFGANSASGTKIEGQAVLSGVATQTGTYADSLTYTLHKGQSQ